MSKEVELAGKIGQLASRFPEEWQDYQDWLSEIMSSHSVLQKRYPSWQAVLIFLWHLFYFVLYLAGVIIVNRILKRLRRLTVARSSSEEEIFSEKKAVVTQSLFRQWLHSLLQRTATLLAVAELTLCAIAALTGIMISFYYQPTALGAYESLSMIVKDVTNGSLILSLHNIAGHSLIVLALVQIIVMFLGREFFPSWLTAWLSGIFLTLTAMGLSWTAIVLNWEQTGFWSLKVESNIIASMPLVGTVIRRILLGGDGINNLTLQHMYTLHSYVLTLASILLSIIHLTALICQEQKGKPVPHLRQALLFSKSATNEDASSV